MLIQHFTKTNCSDKSISKNNLVINADLKEQLDSFRMFRQFLRISVGLPGVVCRKIYQSNEGIRH